jgi:dipeptidyl aminopeptidase/acylaminoacyl peptidase
MTQCASVIASALVKNTLALWVVASLLGCSGTQRVVPSVPWVARNGPSIEQLLNVHRAYAPALSPDGHTVAFLSDTSGLPQPWTTTPATQPAAETSWQRVLTDPERIQFVEFSRDNGALFLGRDHGGNENTQLLRVGRSDNAMTALTNLPEIRHNWGALSDDGRWMAYASNERSRGDFDVYVRPTAAGETSVARRVMEASGNNGAATFSADGTSLIAIEERSNFDQDLYVVDVATSTRRSLTAHPGGGDIRYQSPRFVGTTTSLLVLSDLGREHMNLALLNTTASTVTAPRFVLEEPHDMDIIELAPDGTTLAVVLNLDGYSQLRVYNVRNPEHPTEMVRPSVPPGVISSLSFSADGHTLALDLSRAASPEEIYSVNVTTGAVNRLTQSDHAGIDENALVEPTLERIQSFDETPISMLLYRPRTLAPGERAPVVVQVHGGPEAQFTPYFNAVIQYLVGHGYIVAAPNVRGSTGYGKRFSHLDDVEHREDSVRDLAAVNRWLRARPDVAPDRIAVMGGSYGGYMVLAALTLDPELWAAGCDIVGIANFRTFLERTAPYRRALREAEYGSLAHDGELLDRISPIHKVDRIRAPLFVIHGANDPRVPVGEAEQIVAALRARHHRVEYLRFENEGHGVSRRENRIRAYGDVVRFFDEVMR